jgi:sugar phosphate isomerase/epimerase
MLAVTAITFSNDARLAATQARHAGFAGLLFDAYSTALSLPDLSQTGRREFRHVLAAQQIELVGLDGQIGPKGFGPDADIDRLISRIDRAMEAAAGLAAPLLCLDLGPLPPPPRVAAKPKAIAPEQAGLILIPTMSAKPAEPELPPPPPSAAEVALANHVNDAMAELGRRADRYSVTVAFRSSLAGFAALHQAIAAARCPWFGIDLDPVAMLRDEMPSDEIFSMVGSLIRHVRIRDAIRGADRRTQPAVVGRGSVNWAEFLNQLDAAGYHGWRTVDPVEIADRVAAAKAARDVVSNEKG